MQLYRWRLITHTALLFFIFAICLLPGTTSHAKTFTVAIDGSDSTGNGSVTKPWKSLAHAADHVTSGNTIYVNAGVFTETVPVKLAVGVSLQGGGVTRTVIHAGLDTYLVSVSSPSNVTGNQRISGFTIDGNNKTLRGGILIENVNKVTLDHVNFIRCKEAGSTFVDSSTRDWNKAPDSYVVGSRIHDCQYTNCASVPFKKEDGSPAGMSGNLQIGGLNDAEVYNIVISDIATAGTEDGYGIKFAGGGYFKNLRIHDCTIRVNETAKAWISNFCIELWNVGPGCEIYEVDANTVFSLVNQKPFDQEVQNTINLRVHDCRIRNPRPGGSNNEAIEAFMSGLKIYGNYIENASIGVALWGHGNHLSINNNVFCNTIKMNSLWGQFPTAGIWLDPGNGVYRDIKIQNNVFDNFGNGVRLNVVNGDAPINGTIDGISIINNAFLGTGSAIWETVGIHERGHLQNVVFTHNLKDNNVEWVKNSINVPTPGNLQGDPRFKLVGNRWDSYYRSKTNKCLVVDTGRDIGLPFKGSAPDIGCFEFAPVLP